MFINISSSNTSTSVTCRVFSWNSLCTCLRCDFGNWKEREKANITAQSTWKSISSNFIPEQIFCIAWDRGRTDAGGSKRESWKAYMLASFWKKVTYDTKDKSHVEKFERRVKCYIRHSTNSHGMHTFGLDDSVVQETNLWGLLSQSGK